MTTTLTQPISQAFIAANLMQMNNRGFNEALNNCPFLNYLANKRRIFSGEFVGEYLSAQNVPAIGQPTWVDANGTGMTIDDSDALQAAQWAIKQMAITKVMKLDAQYAAMNPKQQVKWWEAQMDQIVSDMFNNIEASLYGNGTANGGNAVDGLGGAVSFTPTTGIYATLDPATQTYWRNVAVDTSIPSLVYPNIFNGDPTDASNIQSRFRAMLSMLRLNGQNIDSIIVSPDFYLALQESMTTIQRQELVWGQDDHWAMVSGAYLKFDGLFVIQGSGGIQTSNVSYPGMPMGTAYFLNSKTFSFQYVDVPEWAVVKQNLALLEEEGVDGKGREEQGNPSVGQEYKDMYSSMQISRDLLGIIHVPYQQYNEGLYRVDGSLNPRMQFVCKGNLVCQSRRQNGVMLDPGSSLRREIRI